MSLVSDFANQILSFVSDSLSDKLFDVISRSIEEGTFSPETIRTALRSMMSETPVANKAPVRKPVSNSSVSGIGQCMATKKDGSQCANKAKHTLSDGRNVCGVHAKSGGPKQPNPNKRIKTPQQSSSTFELTATSIVNDNDFNIDDVNDIE